MADTTLPEGTDLIIDDAGSAGIGSALETSRPPSSASTGTTGSSVKEALRTGSDKIKSSASDKAMGFVTQGIERSSGALTNVSSLIGDTAASLDERLGSQYGDYARSAAQTIERAASRLANKEPEELIEDARGIVRKSPGIALAGAAILGFALVRIVKSGLEGDSSRTRSTAKTNRADD